MKQYDKWVMQRRTVPDRDKHCESKASFSCGPNVQMGGRHGNNNLQHLQKEKATMVNPELRQYQCLDQRLTLAGTSLWRFTL